MIKLREPTPQEVIALRQASGMSCTEFGALVHVSEASVYAWESGRRGCSVACWELLLIYFGLSRARTLTHSKTKRTSSSTVEELQAEVIHKRVQLMSAGAKSVRRKKASAA